MAYRQTFRLAEDLGGGDECGVVHIYTVFVREFERANGGATGCPIADIVFSGVLTNIRLGDVGPSSFHASVNRFRTTN
jgi:hypothetical protein